MKKETYELTIAPNYVSNWDLKDAFRELIQNGLDQQQINPECEFSARYYFSDNKIIFRNENSHLEIKSLLLGNSSKSVNNDVIGQFGEGYKIAALVLCRLGYTFQIFNYQNSELWTAEIKKSEKWNEDVLTFTVEEAEFGGNPLCIEIGNTCIEDFEEISSIWLNFNNNYYSKIETSFGEILTDRNYKGKVYVNGLFIEEDAFDNFKYGYNFKSQYITLERDRKSCNYWSKSETTSKMICEAVINGKISLEDVAGLFDSNIPDIGHWQYVYSGSEDMRKVSEMLLLQFDKQYPESIPVANQNEVSVVLQLGGKAVMLPEAVASLLQNTTKNRISKLSSTNYKKKRTAKEKLQIWLDTYYSYLSGIAIDQFREIIDDLSE